jgi:2-phospho-L-lactate/phosphoenolpyruvate guanylyltransferase
MTGGVWAIVLVKPFRLAKQRLGPVLSEGERIELARVMLEDVLHALDASTHLAGVFVVTADDAAAAIARRHKAMVIREAAATGMNAAIAEVIDHLSGRPDAGIVVVPADLPQISATEIDEIVALIRRAPAVALVRASSDGGTNVLACRPAGIIAPSFGVNSFNRHCLAAADEGIAPTVRLAPRLGLDVDRPEDLVAFLSLDSPTGTHAYLSRLGIHERVRPEARTVRSGTRPATGER